MAVLALAPFFIGCGDDAQAAKRTQDALNGGGTQDDRAMAQQLLNGAGIEGDVASFIKNVKGTIWSIDYIPKTKAGRGKGGGMMDLPNVAIDASTGKKVTGNVGGGRKGRGALD